MQSRLLFIYEKDMPTVNILRDEFLHLSQCGIVKAHFISLKNVQPSDIENHEVIIFIRPNDTLTPTIAKKIKKSGRFVIIYCDDDLLKRTVRVPWREQGLKRMFHHVDVIWSPSKHICNQYKKFTLSHRIAVMDTIVHKSQIYEKRYTGNEAINREKVKIVYAANLANVSYFNLYIMPIMPKFVKEYNDKISFYFIGVRPELSKYEDKIEIHYIQPMPLHEYRNFMAKHKFDIGIAPLSEDEFTKCKYFNKYIEYSYFGIMGIYSRVIPYTYAVKDYENGMLAENTQESWYNAIKTAIDNVWLRKSCAINAQNDLKQNYSQERILEKLFEDIPELKKYPKKLRKCDSFLLAKIGYHILQPFEWSYILFYHFKIGGIGGFIDRIKMHFWGKQSYSSKK